MSEREAGIGDTLQIEEELDCNGVEIEEELDFNGVEIEEELDCNGVEIEEELDCNGVGESEIAASVPDETEKSEEPPKPMDDGIGETLEIEMELDCNRVGESQIAPSMSCETEKSEEPPKPMAAGSDETLENKGEDADQCRKMNRVKEDLKETAKRHGMTLTDFVHWNEIVVSENSSSVSAENLEQPPESVTGENGEAQQQMQVYPCKPKASMSLAVEDVQLTFQKHGLTLENPTLSRLVPVGESPSSSETENPEEESVALPKPPAKKRRKCRWYLVKGIVKNVKDQLPGPSGTNTSSSKASDSQDQDVSSSESETHEEER